MVTEKKLGNLYGYTGGNFAGNVYEKEGLCPSILTMQGGGKQPMITEKIEIKQATKEGVDLSTRTTGLKTICSRYDTGITNHQNQTTGVIEKIICRQVGRNPDNPKSRKVGIPTKQKLEPTAEGICGALTTVQKDNLCLEIKQATKEGSNKCKVGGCYDASYPDSKTRRGRVQEGGDVTPTLTASNSENIHYVETQYRIRKLTPKECWRLMGYTDEDYEKAAAVNSNTQLYKQAGNAIVKQVLMAIFSQMGIKGVKAWND